MSKRKSDPIDWQAIQLACAVGDRSKAQIARDFGISPSSVYQKARTWQSQDAGKRSKAAEQDHLLMVQRLLKATDKQIRHLEEQHKSGEAAFDEKEARMLGTIARTLDKIMDLNPETPKQPDKAKQSGCDKSKDGANEHSGEQGDLDTLREDLAKRLDRLQQERTGSLSGDIVRN